VPLRRKSSRNCSSDTVGQKPVRMFARQYRIKIPICPDRSRLRRSHIRRPSFGRSPAPPRSLSSAPCGLTVPCGHRSGNRRPPCGRSPARPRTAPRSPVEASGLARLVTGLSSGFSWPSAPGTSLRGHVLLSGSMTRTRPRNCSNQAPDSARATGRCCPGTVTGRCCPGTPRHRAPHRRPGCRRPAASSDPPRSV
jgi:hypothetical protein